MADSQNKKLFSSRLKLETKDDLLKAHTVVAEALRKGEIDAAEARAFSGLFKQAADILLAAPPRVPVPAGRKDVERTGPKPKGANPQGPMEAYGDRGRPGPKNPFAHPVSK